MRFILRWRKATWGLAIFNALMLIWVISGAATASGHPTGCGTLDQATCDAARYVGTGIGVALLVVLWFIGFLVLSLVWLMSRPRRRQCPALRQRCAQGPHCVRILLLRPRSRARRAAGGHPPRTHGRHLSAIAVIRAAWSGTGRPGAGGPGRA